MRHPDSSSIYLASRSYIDSVFLQARGALFTTVCFQFASGDITASFDPILALNNAAGLLYYNATVTVASTDGTNYLTPSFSAWANGNAWDICLQWGEGADEDLPTTDRMQLSYKNASNDDSWTHYASDPYDGEFPASGFLQLLKAAGGNNLIFRNLPQILNKPFTKAQIETEVL